MLVSNCEEIIEKHVLKSVFININKSNSGKTKMKIKYTLWIVFLCMFSGLYAQPVSQIWLDDLELSAFSEGYGVTSISAKKNVGDDSIKLSGTVYSRGIGGESLTEISFLLNGKARKFSAVIGADDIGNKDVPMKFYVIGDQKILFESSKMKVGDPSEKIDIDLSGVNRLGLLVTVSDEKLRKTFSDWANAQFEMLDGQKPAPIPNDGQRYILTPPESKKPNLTSPGLFGVTPGNPFLYTITATGERPVTFIATNLPEGLNLDSKTGIISGKVDREGIYTVVLKARNKRGTAEKKLTVKIGDAIGLTPPMGWNGWNSWGRGIDRDKVISSVDALVNTGLVNHGWSYINIDDCWEGQRSGKYNAIQPNKNYPDFQKMIDYIHSKGLKFGVYSTPWVLTYAGFTGGSSDYQDGIYPDSIRKNYRAYRYIGKYRFEENDAIQLAEWGIDYLKYDWPIEFPSAERMSLELKKSGRDIFFSLSNNTPFDLVKDLTKVSNSWRTGHDIRDTWRSLYMNSFRYDKWALFNGPGHWNDPDMMVLGNVSTNLPMHPSRLTPDEQYTHVSIFCLLAAPLVIGCPIEQLDAFTMNLLTNDEVIAVDQDILGQSARLVTEVDGVQIWLKQMEDGSYAVGLFNIDGYGKTPQSYFRWGDEPVKSFVFDFSKIGVYGKWELRDLWRQKKLGTFSGTFKTTINHHGVVLLRMSPSK